MHIDGRAVPGAIFDFALYFYHNAAALLAKGNGPYFYLPKMESHLECRLWNDIFVDAQASPPWGSGWFLLARFPGRAGECAAWQLCF